MVSTALSPTRPPQPYSATSDQQGSYVFDGVDAGTYALTAEHAGYLTTPYSIGGPASSQSLITLKPGQRMTEVNVRLLPQAVLSGRVLDEDGDPISRATVMLTRRMYMNSSQPR